MRNGAFVVGLLGLGMIAFVPAYAQQSNQGGYSTNAAATAAFSEDPSAPTAVVQVAPPQTSVRPVSRRTNVRWQTYDQPIRECIQGNSIVPSNGNDLFAYLFNNQAAVDVNMAIQGWQHGKCAMTFSEGTEIQYCAFKANVLKALLNEVLNDSQFDRNSELAQVLTNSCQSTNPALG